MNILEGQHPLPPDLLSKISFFFKKLKFIHTSEVFELCFTSLLVSFSNFGWRMFTIFCLQKWRFGKNHQDDLQICFFQVFVRGGSKMTSSFFDCNPGGGCWNFAKKAYFWWLFFRPKFSTFCSVFFNLTSSCSSASFLEYAALSNFTSAKVFEVSSSTHWYVWRGYASRKAFHIDGYASFFFFFWTIRISNNLAVQNRVADFIFQKQQESVVEYFPKKHIFFFLKKLRFFFFKIWLLLTFCQGGRGV